MAWFIAHWWVYLSVSLLCAGYIKWKHDGGNLLFKPDKKDDAITSIWKLLCAYFFAYFAVVAAIVFGMMSAGLFVAAVLLALLT